MGDGGKRESRLGIDDRNRVNIAIGKDRMEVVSYESRFGGQKVGRKVENRWMEKRNQLIMSEMNSFNDVMQNRLKKNESFDKR